MVKEKKYMTTRVSLINRLYRYKFFIILSNWTFQSILYMDKTERMFKILIELVLIAIIAPILLLSNVNIFIVLTISFMAAHTLNWLFNGHFFALSKWLGYSPNKGNMFEEYIDGIKIRAAKNSSVLLIMVYGSVSKFRSSASSDLDVRIVRRAGTVNGLRACFFCTKERATSFLCKFPIDIYVLDDVSRLSLMSKDERPIIVYNPDNICIKSQ